MALESVPLPDDQVNRADPFEVEVEDLTAWPEQRLRFTFDYNDHVNRWLFQAFHVGAGALTRKQVVALNVRYSAWPYIFFEFQSPTGHTDDIRFIGPHELAERVELVCFPGPLGGSFLDDSGLTDTEEEEILTWTGAHNRF